MNRKRTRRQRGYIRELANGTFRVEVYSGVDPLTRKPRYLSEYASTWDEAEKTRTRLLSQVDERRQVSTNATVGQLLDRHLEVSELEMTTRVGYDSKIRCYIRPAIGDLPLGKLDAQVLEELYARLRRCSDPVCTGRRRPGHECRPLARSSVQMVHAILSGALNRAVRWRWIAVNPASQVDPPGQTPANPDPPTPEEAAHILNEAWRIDIDWGTFLWLAMMTGSRRGEMCALRWKHIDLAKAVIWFRRSIAQKGKRVKEKDTKTHQQRRLALDPETVTILSEHLDRCRDRAAASGADLGRDSFVFSLSPDCSMPIRPDTQTQRYGRLVKRLGIDTELKSLRHYSATELIAAGVDLRTVAGRLGHGSGGATTLRVYAAWLPESDIRAAGLIASRLRRPGRTSGGSGPDESNDAPANPGSSDTRTEEV
jgi:integrase